MIIEVFLWLANASIDKLSECINLFFIYFIFHSVFEKDIGKIECKSDQEGEKTHILVKAAGLLLYWNDKFG